MTQSLIIRSNLRENFTVIPNDLANDDRLGADSLGVLLYLLSKPNDWRVRVTDLRKRFSIGKDKAYKIISTLEQYGYITRESVRTGGKFAETLYFVRDLPCPDLSDAVLPDAVFADTYKEKIKQKTDLTKSTNKKEAKKKLFIADLVLSEKLVSYASDYGLDAKEILTDIQLWDEARAKKAQYASLDAFFMQWVRREAKKHPKATTKQSGAIKQPRQLSEKQKDFAHASLAKIWDREKLGEQGYSFKSLLDDVHAYMMTSQTQDDWDKLGNGVKRPF